MKALSLLILVLIAISSSPIGASSTTDDNDIVYVHILPHSHDDVGWLQTPEGYYNSSVRAIYDTVFEQLAQSPEYRFISVEMWFLRHWWEDAATTDLQREQAKKAIQTGQCEIVNGGVVMSDGACTTYEDTVDQLTLGHLWVLDTFGAGSLPKLAWHIDPFGESAEIGNIFAQSGFDGFIINRIPSLIKDLWMVEKKLQFVWRSDRSLDKKSDIWTYALEMHYSTHPGECNWPGGAPPLNDSNIDHIAQLFYDNVMLRRDMMRTSHVLWPYGSDFEWANAKVGFENMDELMAYIQNDPKRFGSVKLMYSTLGEYVDAVHATNMTWDVRKYDDFFTYDDSLNAFWSGYFTSQIHLKGISRKLARVVKPADQLLTTATALQHFDLAKVKELNGEVERARQALAVIQHHDAITGTATLDVVEDYIDRMVTSMECADKAIIAAVEALSTKPGSPRSPSLTTDNSVLQGIQPGESEPIILYNPISRAVKRFVNIAVSTTNLKVVDAAGNDIPSQINIDPEYEYGHLQVWFEATLPAHGFVVYFIVGLESGSSLLDFYSVNGDDIVLENAVYSIMFNSSGRLSAIKDKSSSTGISLDMTQDYLEYKEFTAEGQQSGPYIWAPLGLPELVNPGNIEIEVLDGPLVKMVKQTWSTGHVLITRLFVGSGECEDVKSIDQVHIVGPIGENRELVTRFETNIDTDRTFYTDNNGAIMQKRVYSDLHLNPIPANTYPLVNSGYLRSTGSSEDDQLQLTVISDRSHGASSQNNGDFEVVLYRRMNTSDHRGPTGTMDSTDTNRIAFKWFVSDFTKSSERRHSHIALLNFPPRVLYSTAFMSCQMYDEAFVTSFSSLSRDMPENVEVMSNRIRSVDGLNTRVRVILRLRHIFEKGEHPTLSQPASIDISTLFTNVAVTNVEERTLSAAWALNARHPLHWNTDGGDGGESEGESGGNVVVLEPGTTRTFFVDFVFVPPS